MRPGLDAIRALCAALGDPQKRFRAIHVAGTNGKGAVCALLSAALVEGRVVVGRYTSPHLVKLNERFCINDQPLSDDKLEKYAGNVESVLCQWGQTPEVTFFEALTAVGFLAFADAKVDVAVLECGLGGRLDATNVCEPELCVITRIGLDHCDWLGDTIDKIAAEKAGIVKPGVPVVLGANDENVRAVISSRAREVGAPFFYAPDLADESEIPSDMPLSGAFNRENAVTAIAALRVLARPCTGFAKAVWPGRFQRVGDYIVDGAHNPPAATALASALSDEFPGQALPMVAGFCGDKDVSQVLRTLAPHVSRCFAVRTNNPRSLSAEETAAKMREAGIPAEACGSLEVALSKSREGTGPDMPTLVCGSLFLAGEALVALDAYPWGDVCRIDPSEALRSSSQKVGKEGKCTS
jgi:dihydrofolate synthase/folylpolyglutamate synthase